MSKIQVGIIGTGMWGKTHIRHFQKNKRAKVRWVCDNLDQLVADAQSAFDVKHGTTDYREMLADPKLDAVVIATPAHLHAPMAIDAIRAGKHTLIEKPMAIDTDGIQAILEAMADEPDVAVLEGSARHSRLQPKFEFIRNFIREGRLGDVYHIHHVMAQQSTFIEYNPDGAWAMNKATAGGGPVLDWGVYDLSFHLGILNDLPELVDLQGFSKNGLRDLSKIIPETDIEQHAIALMTFDTGMTYYYERGAGLHMEIPGETRIYGTQGGLRFSYLTWESNKIQYFHGQKKPKQRILKVSMKQHAHHDNLPLVKNFLDCIEGKAAPAMRAQLAAKHLQILLKITTQEKALPDENSAA